MATFETLADNARNLYDNASSFIQFYVNKDFKKVFDADPRKSLLDYLRENGYTGTKYGCGEGVYSLHFSNLTF